MSRRKSNKKVAGIPIARSEFLKIKPIRHPESTWKENEKGLHVKIPRKRTFVHNLFSKFLPLARERRVLLDEQGKFIWMLCDGEHQIRQIAKKLSERYNIRVADAEEALDVYFVQLSKQHLVGFVLPESARKRYQKKFGTKNLK